MEVHFKSQVFDLAGHISILIFFWHLKRFLISKGSPKSLPCKFPIICEEDYKDHNLRKTTVDKKRRGKDGKLTSYERVVNYLLEMYEIEDTTSETETETDT